MTTPRFTAETQRHTGKSKKVSLKRGCRPVLDGFGDFAAQLRKPLPYGRGSVSERGSVSGRAGVCRCWQSRDRKGAVASASEVRR